MLNSRQLEIISATVPVLQVHAETITRTFYGLMFEAHPELKDVFNMAHQAVGEQPRALAQAVIAYAANIESLQNLGPAVSRIAHRHCSLDITADQYDIVGEFLLKAIGVVLGEAATPEIVDAWAAAYGQLAEIFIRVEGDLYEENRQRGWTGFKPFRVVAKTPESDCITSFVFEPADGTELPTFHPGQYLTVRFSGDAWANVEMRQYSISSAPNGKSYRVSVKQEEGGQVSNHLHQSISVGDTVLVHMPHGEFFLDTTQSSPVALISGGVGITPLLSMLESILSSDSKRPVSVVHAAQSPSSLAFGNYLRELESQHDNLKVRLLVEQPDTTGTLPSQIDAIGRVSPELLTQVVPSDADVYFCGPRGFMRTVDELLSAQGIPDERRHWEIFGPTTGLQEPAPVA